MIGSGPIFAFHSVCTSAIWFKLYKENHFRELMGFGNRAEYELIKRGENQMFSFQNQL